MIYYSLDPNDSAVAKWSDDRSVEFLAQMGRDEEVQKIVAEFELLRDYSVPMYTEKRLRYFFPEMTVVSEDKFNNILLAIDEYNVGAAAMHDEAESLSNDQIQSFISSFPVRNNNLVSYLDVSDLVKAFASSLEEDLQDEIARGRNPDQAKENRETLKAIYIMLKNTENTSNTDSVQSILSLVRGR